MTKYKLLSYASSTLLLMTVISKLELIGVLNFKIKFKDAFKNDFKSE